jgi:putative transposase
MMKSEVPIGRLCEALEVSCSGYYDWERRQKVPSARKQEDIFLRNEIRKIHQESQSRYGSPRVQLALSRRGMGHGRNRVARLMREQGLVGRQRKRFRLVTTDSNHDQPIAANRLAELDRPTAPNQIWAGDITYIRTDEGWLYVAAVIDLYSRRIVGWAMSDRIDAELVLAAWNMALTHRNPPNGIIFHSDRGVQYACEDFRNALKSAKAVASMSRKANCYDNATMESFWSTLKLELIYRKEYSTRSEATFEIFDYIETFYNRTRIHSSLGYYSPIDFENQNN